MNFIYETLRILYNLPKNLYKKINLIIYKYLFRINKNYLRRKFIELGLKKGMNIYVHSSLSSFGYIEGGANTIINALDNIIKNGTIMIPTFTHSKKEFKLNNPCWTGKVAEKFRNNKNVKRSIHPTHSVAVKGKYADYLTKNHERSRSPFDRNSPFSRFAKLNSYILMLGTENNSMIHYIQNKVKFPNLFLPEFYKFRSRNKIINTKMHHPKGSITYIYNKKPCTDVKFLVNMYKDEKFEEKGYMKTVRIGNATCHLINTKNFVKASEKYLKNNIKRYKSQYSSLIKNG